MKKLMEQQATAERLKRDDSVSRRKEAMIQEAEGKPGAAKLSSSPNTKRFVLPADMLGAVKGVAGKKHVTRDEVTSVQPPFVWPF